MSAPLISLFLDGHSRLSAYFKYLRYTTSLGTWPFPFTIAQPISITAVPHFTALAAAAASLMTVARGSGPSRYLVYDYLPLITAPRISHTIVLHIDELRMLPTVSLCAAIS